MNKMIIICCPCQKEYSPLELSSFLKTEPIKYLLPADMLTRFRSCWQMYFQKNFLKIMIKKQAAPQTWGAVCFFLFRFIPPSTRFPLRQRRRRDPPSRQSHIPHSYQIPLLRRRAAWGFPVEYRNRTRIDFAPSTRKDTL